MVSLREAIDARLWQYARRTVCVIEKELGFGFDGIVFSTDRQSALKAFRYEPLYLRERDVYLRLQEHGIVEMSGFKVPRLLGFDDALWIVEMTIVSPPFALDFAGAYLDDKPEFPDDVLHEWLAEKLAQFGDRWPEVRLVMAAFARLGIFLADVKPGNIEFGDE
jgi:hypothetical protein